MFIPRGQIIHESLATSYVLLDALVADLCEGGFSGVVEVVLLDTDSFITIASGVVVAVLEKRGGRDEKNGAAITCARTTVEELAERARRERGRISIYGYSSATAIAVAGRINAHPLYVGLSTEFTDLEKMIGKLARERDREWFIEVNSEDGQPALIHMHDTGCGIVGSTGDADSGPLDLSGNTRLARLVDDFMRTGGTFDVYFARPEETIIAAEPSPSETEHETPAQIADEDEEAGASVVESLQPAVEEQLPPDDSLTGANEANVFTFPDLEPDFEAEPQIEALHDRPSVFPAESFNFEAMPEAKPAAAIAENTGERQAGDLSLVRDELPPVAVDAEAMTEIRRLMGEIARAVEEAAQAVGRPDSFSMSLRGGQLKVADRFPFLDPFAGEFEYLAGEIVFVGRATAEEFILGLTEALKVALEAVARSTPYADKFRAYVAEDLRKLSTRERTAFETLGLDRVVTELTSL